MTTPITKEQFTKEQLQRIIEISDEVISAVAGTNEDVHQESDEMIRLWDCLNDVVAPPEVVRELARIAQTAKGAEPVYQWRERYEEGSLWEDCTKEQYDGFAKNPECEARILFITPPAPVVPDARYQHLSDLYHAQEKRLFKLAQRIKGPSFDKYAYSPSQAIDVLESAIFGDIPDASAAMLNHSEDERGMVEPVSQPYKLEGGENCWSCGKYFTYEQHSECDGYCPHCNSPVDLDEAVGNSGNSPAIPDGWQLVPVIAFPSQWAAGQKALISAGINKVDAVYKAMVAAAPQQERK